MSYQNHLIKILPMNDYCPLSCELSDRLEEIALLKRHCIITYSNEQNQFIQVNGQIVDIYAADGADWCKLKDGQVIRLDRIEDFQMQ